MKRAHVERPPMRVLALLLAALVAAGCLESGGTPTGADAPARPSLPIDILPEEPPPPTLPEPTPPTVATPPVPSPPTTPSPSPPRELPPGETLLHRNKRALDGDVAHVSAPANVERLRLLVEANASLRWQGEVRLVAPDGSVRARCEGGPCEAFVSLPEGGRWRIEFDLDVPGEVATTITALMAERAPERTQHLLHQRALDLLIVGERAEEDVFRVQDGYDRVVLKARGSARAYGGVTLRLLDAAGVQRGVCDASSPACEIEVPDPASGLWRARYVGSSDGRLDVTVHGLAADAKSIESNYTAFEASHAFTLSRGGNVTIGFYVREGHQTLGFQLSFVHPGLVSDEDRPRVILRAPDGTIAARCEIDAGGSCPSRIPAAPGLWRVALIGPGSGSVHVSAFVFAPGEPAPVEPAPRSKPLEAATARVYEAARVPFPKRTDTLPLLTTSGRLTGSIEIEGDARVLLTDPEGKIVLDCNKTCSVDAPVTWAGPWSVTYAGGDGLARVTLDLAASDVTRGGGGRYATVYGFEHPPGEANRAGLMVPGGWTTLSVWVNATMPDRTGAFTLTGPDGSTSRCVGGCSYEMPARSGMWELGYDLDAAVRVTARLS